VINFLQLRITSSELMTDSSNSFVISYSFSRERRMKRKVLVNDFASFWYMCCSVGNNWRWIRNGGWEMDIFFIKSAQLKGVGIGFQHWWQLTRNLRANWWQTFGKRMCVIRLCEEEIYWMVRIDPAPFSVERDRSRSVSSVL
jgi:hypothetical protein